MTPISKREIKQRLDAHRPDIVARLHVNNKLVNAILCVGERRAYEPLCASKFRILVDYFESIGFANKTALRLARFGCGRSSNNPDRLFYVVDGQLVGQTDIKR